MAVSLRAPDVDGRPLRVLAIGAHADDIEIGCGGTMLGLAAERQLETTWVVAGAADPERAEEARRSAAAFLDSSQVAEVVLGDFRDAYMPYEGERLKEFVQGLSERCDPDVVFTHQRHDLHQDHRLLSELTWNAFRDSAIFEYEIPKWDGDLGAPNAFVQLSRDTARAKVALLMEHFASQRSKDWFKPETFEALMHLRAVECRAPEGAAEAFYARKLTLDLR